MNYLEMQKTEFEKKQIMEGLERLRLLNLHPNVEKDYWKEGKLNLSESAILYWLNDAEIQMVNNWQNKTGNKVYHVIKSYHEFGVCYSFLYVSTSPEEWEWDREDLQNQCPIVYVLNANNSFFSEYGSIGIQSLWGGLIRTA